MKPKKPKPRSQFFKNNQSGGVALEYVLVTTFAAIAGIASLGFVSKVIHGHLEKMGDKLGVDTEEFQLTPFSRDD